MRSLEETGGLERGTEDAVCACVCVCPWGSTEKTNAARKTARSDKSRLQQGSDWEKVKIQGGSVGLTVNLQVGE